MKPGKFITLFYLVPILCVTLYGCAPEEPTENYQPAFSADTSGNKTLVLGFPSFSYCEKAELMVKYLNKNLSGVHVITKACTNWDDYVNNLNQNKFDITLVNGILAVDASHKGYSILGKIVDDSQYSGVIFARKEAQIKTVSDLKGLTIAMAASNTVPGTMMPLYYLYENGLNVNKDIKTLDASSFESAIISTYLAKSEAGLCLKRNWIAYVNDHPEVLSKIELKWETPPLINNALLLNNAIDQKLTSRITDSFFSMHTTAEGREALKLLSIGGFEKANRETYQPVLDFKRKYDAAIH